MEAVFSSIFRIDLRQAGYPEPFAGFRRRSPALRELYPLGPAEWEAAEKLAEEISARNYPRVELAEILEEKYPGAPEPVRENISRLKDPGTLVVITGQQPGLFGGPMYDLYKTITVLKTARAAEDALRKKVIPVFWVAGEDHDIDEVNRLGLFSGGRPVNLKMELSTGGRALEDVVLPESGLKEAFAGLRETLGGAAFANETLGFLEKHWRPGRDWSAAFTDSWREIFDEFGLLVVEPRDLRRLAAPMLVEHLSNCAEVHRMVNEQGRRLGELGLPALLGVGANPETEQDDRADKDSGAASGIAAPWIFRVGGERRRRLPAGVDIEKTAAEIRARPENFSCGVVLRVLVQNALLPVLYYCPGPGELLYWGQLGEVHRRQSLPFPGLWPRMTGTIIEPKVSRAAAKLGLAPADFFLHHDKLAMLIRERAGAVEELSQLKNLGEEVKQDVLKLLKAAKELAPGAGAEFERMAAKMDYQAERLVLRAEHYCREKLGVGENRLRTLTSVVKPWNKFQERAIGSAYFLAKLGPLLVNSLLEAVQPDSNDHFALFV